MAYQRQNNPKGDVDSKWSNDSAFNVGLALEEARHWIETVTKENFKSNDFQESTKDGVLLIKLLNQIKPGIIGKINPQNNSLAHRENLSAFIGGCKQLGLKDTQLFTSNDLYEGQRLRTVSISLYWLGRAARAVPNYKGPQLDVAKFAKMNCQRCKKPIHSGQDYLTTLNSQWHVNCANCDHCHKPFDFNKGYFEHPGPSGGKEIWCPPCHEGDGHGHDHGHGGKPHDHKHAHPQKQGPKCPLCSKPQVENEEGNLFCPDCACNSCGKSVPADKLIPTFDGYKICHDCGDPCDSCHYLIQGPYADLGNGKKVCKDCLCDDCNHPLGDNVRIIDGKKVCPKCRCHDCKKPMKNTGYVEVPKGSDIFKCPDCAGENSSQNLGGFPKNCTDCGKKYSPKDEGTTQDLCAPCNKKKHGDHGHGHGHPHDHGCGGCGKPLGNGPVIQAGTKKFHQPCFKCGECGGGFPDGKYTDRDGVPVCNKCTSAKPLGSGLKSPSSSSGLPSRGNCAACKEPCLGNDALGALNKVFHPNCFRCVSCDTDFPDGNFVELNNAPYCKPCSAAQAGSCFGCKKPLSGQVTEVKGNTFHKGCFKCNRCDKDLDSSYHPFKDHPYCRPCHDVVSGADCCSKCFKPITDAGFQIGNHLFHPQCTSCNDCNTDLKTAPVVQLEFGEPVCGPCHNKRGKGVHEHHRPGFTNVNWDMKAHGPRRAGFSFNQITKQKEWRDVDGKKIDGPRVLKSCPGCLRGVGDADKACKHCGKKL